MATNSPEVVGFFDPNTFSVQYVCIDNDSARCAIIDPVLDYDPQSARTNTTQADEIAAFVRKRGLTVDWILDTHPHADHLSAAIYLQEIFDAPRAIGEHVVAVQKLWKDIYNFGDDFHTDGRQWDRLFADGDTFKLGNLDARVMHSPGHTLASITYVIGDAAFVHDTLFQPDFGTARADFPGGDAATLYRSIQAILDLPDDTRLFTGHDYMPDGREPCWESTVAEQRANNPHLKNIDEASYIELRNKRDAQLPLPTLILAALQINTRGGRMPEPEANGTAYLKIPLNVF
ncbi:metallo-beta-lactamase family protein [Salinisphaera sp. T5B8]|uniref:MBL fold metallo-hydrolase n=1 Tax=unclassified Salinisphaera TaxID=2649847 RepID=UPI00334125EA